MTAAGSVQATVPSATAAAGPPPPRPRLPLRDRLAGPMPTDRLAGWFWPLAITLVAGVMRMWHVTTPRGTYFDEVYYPKDAYGLLTHGYELNENCTGGGFVVHPPLGKWMIALSEKIWGYSACGQRHGSPELGWRFASVVAGTITILIIARTARRMFRSTLLGCFAGLLTALDGMEFVQSRIGILDIFVLLWVAAALGCLVRDRDDGRERLAARLAGAGRDRGPRLGIRPWRLGAGVCVGAAMAVKWSGFYSLVGFAALAIAWDIGARRTAGIPHPVRAALRTDGPGWLLAFVLVPAAVYTASWTGWFLSDGGWDRHLYGNGFVATIHGWLEYHIQIKNFHEHLDATHPYASKPFGWLVLGRPVAFSYSAPKLGQAGCHAAGGCSQEILDLGNPAIWWVGIAGLVGTAAVWVTRRDWRAALILVGFLSGFLPWLLFPSRTMFIFYALPLLPFVVLGLTLLAGIALGPRDASDTRRLWGGLGVGAYAIVVLVLFAYLYPILAAQVIPTTAWRARMWFPGWI